MRFVWFELGNKVRGMLTTAYDVATKTREKG
jgi:hypothetical protein